MKKIFDAIIVFFLIGFIALSGCVNIFQTDSCSILSHAVVDNHGYPTVELQVNVTGSITLKLFNPSGAFMERKQLTSGVQTVTFDVAGYHETPLSGVYTLEAYDKHGKTVAQKTFVLHPPLLSINGLEGEWWREGVNSYSLTEITLSVENKGNAPVYLDEINVEIDENDVFTAPVLQNTVEVGVKKQVSAFFYIPNLKKMEHKLSVRVFDYSGNMVASNEFSDTPSYKMSTEKFSLSWRYKGKHYSITLPVPEKLLEFYVSIKRPLLEDYTFYVISPYDDNYVTMISHQLFSLYNKEGEDLVNFIGSFTQSITYKEEEGEYPEFPVELLHNRFGDCEDKAIFASALLKNLGYDVALLRFPDHMAVGVHIADANYENRVYYQDFSGKKYLFLETSNTAWTLGEADEKYQNVVNFTLYPVISKPILIQECEPLTRYTSMVEDYIQVDTIVKNIGTRDADNVRISVVFLTPYGTGINGKSSDVFSVAAGKEKRVSFTVDYPDTAVAKVYVRVIHKGVMCNEVIFVFD
ncbi:MAG TPA: hypothetical protein EYP23_01010 [Thermoplasmata archaeon]|nr:hypothetical protein [Thermoplasmata archaeon]